MFTDIIEPYDYTQYYNGEVYLENTVTDSYLKSSGVVYLKYDGKTLPVCFDNSCSKFAADSTCRQLGYTEATVQESIE